MPWSYYIESKQPGIFLAGGPFPSYDEAFAALQVDLGSVALEDVVYAVVRDDATKHLTVYRGAPTASTPDEFKSAGHAVLWLGVGATVLVVGGLFYFFGRRMR